MKSCLNIFRSYSIFWNHRSPIILLNDLDAIYLGIIHYMNFALADKAEVEGDMTVLGRSNDLRKLSKTKKSDLSELDDMIASLESRRDSLK